MSQEVLKRNKIFSFSYGANCMITQFIKKFAGPSRH